MIKAYSLIAMFAIFLVNIYFYHNKPDENSPEQVLTAGTVLTSVQADTIIDPVLQKAQTNFKNYCSGCHGEQMQAFVDREWKHGNTREDIIQSITNGYADKGMPSFKAVFTDEEIEGLADYILKGVENVGRYAFQDEVIKSDTFQTEKFQFSLDTVASDLEVPWGMAFLPDGDMLVTERSGIMYRLTQDRSLQEVEGVPEVLAEGQGGLLDVELHPDFEQNRWVYLSYSIPKVTGEDTLSTTAITRAKLQGNTLIQQEKIFEALPYSTKRHHYGSRLEFGRDGFLYFSVGDRGNRDENPQNLDNHCGKIHRIKDDGSIPSDNPFVSQQEAMPSIYSYGHRNPQGLALNPATGVMWSHEHGPRGGDEVNIIRKATNYGWPVISYGINYDGTSFTQKTSQEGMEQPILYWVPSIAPSGMAFVKGDRYKGWEGDLLVGSMRYKYLNRCKIENNKVVDEEILMKNIGRVRNVEMGSDGYIYVAVENPGAIFRLVAVENL